MKTAESLEKAEIDGFLRSIGAEYFIMTTFGYGGSGAPDRVACIYGTFWGIEVKREGKEPTPKQQQRMNRIIKAGGQAVAGTAADVIPVIKKWLDKKLSGAIR